MIGEDCRVRMLWSGKVVEWEGGGVEECKREREAAQNKKAMARRNQVNKHVI